MGDLHPAAVGDGEGAAVGGDTVGCCDVTACVGCTDTDGAPVGSGDGSAVDDGSVVGVRVVG